MYFTPPFCDMLLEALLGMPVRHPLRRKQEGESSVTPYNYKCSVTLFDVNLLTKQFLCDKIYSKQ